METISIYTPITNISYTFINKVYYQIFIITNVIEVINDNLQLYSAFPLGVRLTFLYVQEPFSFPILQPLSIVFHFIVGAFFSLIKDKINPLPLDATNIAWQHFCLWLLFLCAISRKASPIPRSGKTFSHISFQQLFPPLNFNSSRIYFGVGSEVENQYYCFADSYPITLTHFFLKNSRFPYRSDMPSLSCSIFLSIFGSISGFPLPF